MKLEAVTLLFHDVVPEGRWELSGFMGADADVYKLDCADFQRHVAAIAPCLRRPPATCDELLAGAPADRAVLITFDDGGVSAALYIADILDQLGWKAHFLVTTGRIGTQGFLDPAQILELRRRGHVIGSHSHTHPLLMANCSVAQLHDEWGRSTGGNQTAVQFGASHPCANGRWLPGNGTFHSEARPLAQPFGGDCGWGPVASITGVRILEH
jgi:hypothetical protein